LNATIKISTLLVMCLLVDISSLKVDKELRKKIHKKKSEKRSPKVGQMVDKTIGFVTLKV
jgi:hypothetical protein